MKVLVCGGRDYPDEQRVFDVLDALHAERPITFLAEGGAKRWNKEAQAYFGADWFAWKWRQARNVPGQTFEANWRRFGFRAGPIRNRQMRDEVMPDLVVALPGGVGTADMCRQAREVGIPVREVA